MAVGMQQFVTVPQAAPEKRSAAERRRDFREIAEGFDPAGAAAQASRCSQCGIPFCQVHCPLTNAIPDWLKLTAEGRLLIARSDLAMWEERAAWSSLMAGPGRRFVTAAQSQADAARLKRAGLVNVRVGDDRRVRVIALTAKGLERFAVAMPLWERAQSRADELLSLDELRSVARKVRKAARAAA